MASFSESASQDPFETQLGSWLYQTQVWPKVVYELS